VEETDRETEKERGQRVSGKKRERDRETDRKLKIELMRKNEKYKNEKWECSIGEKQK
jgi:hypothetical protein